MAQTFTGNIYNFGERTLEIVDKITRITSTHGK